MPLSMDLRKRVMSCVDDKKLSIAEIARRFGITRRTIYDWIELREKTSSLNPIIDYQKGHSHTITDWPAFEGFVAGHAHLTAPEMCTIWEKINGRRITKSVMKRGLQQLGYTFKKNNFVMRSRTNNRELSLYKR